MKSANKDGYNSGLYLFTDRNTITHLFRPNFLPPYDTKKKRKIILDCLSEKWDEKSLTFKPVRSVVDVTMERWRMKMANLMKKKTAEEEEHTRKA